MRPLVLLVSAFFALLIGMAALALAPLIEHSRRESPDGAFVAIARTEPAYSVIPVMPGQGSDIPGQVTVYRGSLSCGSVWIPSVSLFYDLRWELDRRPRRAGIKLAATWNLDDCSLESLSRG